MHHRVPYHPQNMYPLEIKHTVPSQQHPVHKNNMRHVGYGAHIINPDHPMSTGPLYHPPQHVMLNRNWSYLQ